MNENYIDSEFFEIQLKHPHINKFLFQYCLSQMAMYIFCNYDDNSFGSWYIELLCKRIIYDGRDGYFIIQYKSEGKWEDYTMISRNDLSYSIVNRLISEVLT